MQSKFYLFVAALTLLSSAVFSENSVSISQIQGLDPARGLMIDVPIRYYLQFDVGDEAITASMNRFKLYSPDGATWSPVIGHETLMLNSIYDGYHGFTEGQFVSNGVGLDTLSFGGFSINAPGFPASFSGEVFFFETSLSEEDLGKTLCFDSLIIEPPFDTWVWQKSNFELFAPSWSEQNCFTLVDCCVGNRGDVNGDGIGPNILDLTKMVDYIFRGGLAPICNNESDLNSDGIDHNVMDLTFVVDFVFRGGPAPAACPYN